MYAIEDRVCVLKQRRLSLLNHIVWQYTITYFSFRADNVEEHLAIDSQQWLLADYLSSANLSECDVVDNAADTRTLETPHDTAPHIPFAPFRR